MTDSLPTFSESWHRVAAQNLRLRRGVKVRRQMFRGERWYVIEDDLAGKYFRVRPDAWEFIMRLDAGLTVEDAWDVLRAKGYRFQYAGSGFRALHPGRKLVGRAVTAQYLPTRPDLQQFNGSAEYMPDSVTMTLSRTYCDGSFFNCTP